MCLAYLNWNTYILDELRSSYQGSFLIKSLQGWDFLSEQIQG